MRRDDAADETKSFDRRGMAVVFGCRSRKRASDVLLDLDGRRQPAPVEILKRPLSVDRFRDRGIGRDDEFHLSAYHVPQTFLELRCAEAHCRHAVCQHLLKARRTMADSPEQERVQTDEL